VASHRDANDDFGNVNTLRGEAIFNGNEGRVSGRWTKAESPYVVVGEVTVYEFGPSLEIDPGVEVRFLRGTGITADTGLRVAGTVTDSVRFTSHAVNPAPGDWTARFNLNAQVDVDHTVFEYATSLSCEGVMTIRRSAIRSCKEAGVYQWGSRTTLDRCLIENNLGPGVWIEKAISIENCVIRTASVRTRRRTPSASTAPRSWTTGSTASGAVRERSRSPTGVRPPSPRWPPEATPRTSRVSSMSSMPPAAGW
jgi:hypothetical protein